MISRKWFAVLLLIVALALPGCGSADLEEEAVEETGDEVEKADEYAGDEELEKDAVVAVVNGESILREEFDEMLNMRLERHEMQEVEEDVEGTEEMQEMLEQQVLDELIAREVLLQNAEAAGIVSDDETVQEEYQQIKAQFEEEEFKEALEAQNMTSEELKENIAFQHVVQGFVDEKIEERLGEEAYEISEDELQAAYDQYSLQMDDLPDFEEMKPQLEEMLVQEKQQEFTTQLINELVAESDIEILL